MSGELLNVVFQCEQCGQEFNSLRLLIAHLSEWKRTALCPKKIISVRVVN